jgi:hypothetical protein
MSKWMAVVVAVLTAAGALVPAVAYAIGRKDGPCTVSVNCAGGYRVSCGGQRVCYWRTDLPAGTGFVQCDSGEQISCTGGVELDEDGLPIIEVE